MKEQIISLNDKHSITDLLLNDEGLAKRLQGNHQKTKIAITDANTGELLGEYSNKILTTGSMFSACKAFGIESELILPSYNTEMHFEEDQAGDRGNYDESFVCLFCVGDDGCGETQKDVFVCNYDDRIEPLNKSDLDTGNVAALKLQIFPFRWQSAGADLPDELRKYYFGRKIYGDKIAYFFKKFDTTPELHVKYADGTQVDDNMYTNDTDQGIECYIETRLRITRNDFRDYFENVIGWDNARISTVSLCYAKKITR